MMPTLVSDALHGVVKLRQMYTHTNMYVITYTVIYRLWRLKAVVFIVAALG